MFAAVKGGVAKTFTVANMAYELYRQGYKVLLIDNDKQGNLSKAYSRYIIIYDARQFSAVFFQYIHDHFGVSAGSV